MMEATLSWKCNVVFFKKIKLCIVKLLYVDDFFVNKLW